MFKNLKESVGFGIILAGVAAIGLVFAYNWAVNFGILKIGTEAESIAFMASHVTPLSLMVIGFLVNSYEAYCQHRDSEKDVRIN